jgi:hypothetical protein
VASFAFLVGYQRDGRAPQGAMLRFAFAGLAFESSHFDAQGLGEQRIMYRGRGRLNGEEGRQFALTRSPRARGKREPTASGCASGMPTRDRARSGSTTTARPCWRKATAPPCWAGGWCCRRTACREGL